LRWAVGSGNFPLSFFAMRFLVLSLCLFAVAAAFAEDKLDLAPLKKWIARQDEVRTIQADFTQTRKFRALRDPLTGKGRLAFNASTSAMRWELGDPPKMVVIRKGDAFWIIQANKKTVERLSAADINKAGSSRGIAVPSFPIAKDFASFNRQFEVLAIQTAEGRCHVEILPREAQARKFLAAIKLDFEIGSGHLLSFEIVTRDGGSMRNEFFNVRMNQKIDPRTFDFDLTGYEVVDAKE
jgi:outer membrane lipoprotein carrier protein